MPWLIASLGNQQPWYWLWRMNSSCLLWPFYCLSVSRKERKYLYFSRKLIQYFKDYLYICVCVCVMVPQITGNTNIWSMVHYSDKPKKGAEGPHYLLCEGNPLMMPVMQKAFLCDDIIMQWYVHLCCCPSVASSMACQLMLYYPQ